MCLCLGNCSWSPSLRCSLLLCSHSWSFSVRRPARAWVFHQHILEFPEKSEVTTASRALMGFASKACVSTILVCSLPSWKGVWLLCYAVAQSCLTLCGPVDCSTPGFPVHHQLPELAQTHAHRVSDAIQPSHPLSSPFPPDFNLSHHQGLFQWLSSLHQVAKVLDKLCISFSICTSNEYSGLISFRMDWLDPRAVQGTLKSLLQHHSSKASIL